MSRPDSIRAIGLKKFLNKSSIEHRRLGYDAFVAMVDGGASVTSMAKSFNVSRFTIDKWIAIYREEGARRERANSQIASQSS